MTLIQRAIVIVVRAREDLGYDLGGYSVVDLLLDNMLDIDHDQATELALWLPPKDTYTR